MRALWGEKQSCGQGSVRSKRILPDTPAVVPREAEQRALGVGVGGHLQPRRCSGAGGTDLEAMVSQGASGIPEYWSFCTAACGLEGAQGGCHPDVAAREGVTAPGSCSGRRGAGSPGSPKPVQLGKPLKPTAV